MDADKRGLRVRQFLDSVLASLLVAACWHLLTVEEDARWGWVETVMRWRWDIVLAGGWSLAAVAAFVRLHHAGPDPYPEQIARRLPWEWVPLQIPAVVIAAGLPLQDGCWVVAANGLGSAALACMVVGALRLDTRAATHPLHNISDWVRRIPPSRSMQDGPEGPIVGMVLGLGALAIVIALTASISGAVLERRPGVEDGGRRRDRSHDEADAAEGSTDPSSPAETAPPLTTEPPPAESAVAVDAEADLTG